MSEVINIVTEKQETKIKALINAISYLRIEALRLNCIETARHLDESQNAAQKFLLSGRGRVPRMGDSNKNKKILT
jgi:hypothetical protein